MFISPGICSNAKSQGTKQLAWSALPGEPLTQVNAVVDLLANSTSPAAQPAARSLLQQMSNEPWQIIRGAHKSANDPTLHVTIEVAETRYHLRLDGKACIFDITTAEKGETQRPAGRLPWVGPGA